MNCTELRAGSVVFDLLPGWARLPWLADEYEAGRIGPDEMRDRWPDAWKSADAPGLLAGPPERLVRIWRDVGLVDETGELPSDPLTVFRGATPAFALGCAWTTSLEQARFFAGYGRQLMARLHVAMLRVDVDSLPINFRESVRLSAALAARYVRPALQGAAAHSAGSVLRASVPPGGVLARLTDRNEGEVVVDPAMLFDVEDVDEAGAKR